MLSYCLECRKKIQKVKTWGLQRQKKENQCFYQYVQCGHEESRFIKKQGPSGLLLGPNSPLNKIPVLGTNF